MSDPTIKTLTGVLYTPNERGDGTLRDQATLLRPVPGAPVIPRKVIDELKLRPSNLLEVAVRPRAPESHWIPWAAAVTVLVVVVPAIAGGSHVGVGLNARDIAGFPGDFSGGQVFLTGGGAYDPATASNADPESGFVHSNGGFRCVEDVRQGPLQGCLAGEGVRWDTDGLLQSTRFKCTGAAAEPGKTAVTAKHTAVLKSDFYRAGDGDDASFKGALVIVSDHDLAPDIDGVQNVRIQQVGCGTADVNFSS